MQNSESPATQSPWKVDPQQPLAPRAIDLDWLESQPLLPFLVAASDPVSLWHALSERGLQDTLEVVEWIRGRQLLRVLDLDLWNKDAGTGVSDVSAERFLEWVGAWREIGPGFAAARFAELEEETITLIVSKLVNALPLFPEEAEVMLETRVREAGIDPENYWTTPDKRFIIAVRPGLEDAFDRIKSFIDELYAENLRYAGHVLAYSCALLRNETLEEAERVRAGRLADAGFVPEEEARERLARTQSPDTAREIARRLEDEDLPSAPSATAAKAIPSVGDEVLDEDVEDAIVGLLQSMPPEDIARYAETVLGNERLSELLSGVPELFPPQYLAEDEDILRNLIAQSGTKARRLLSHVEAQGLRSLPAGRVAIERALSYLANEEPDSMGPLKASIFRLGNVLAALRPRSLALATARESAEVVRGLLNIGLEAVSDGSDAQLPEGIALGSDAHLARVVRKVGPELLFRRGWEDLAALRRRVAERITSDFAVLAGATIPVTLSDGSQTRYELTRLIEAARFGDVQRWLNLRREALEPVMFDVLRGILSEVPVFPTALDQSSPHAVISGHRAFQSRADLETAARLFDSLKLAREEASHAEAQI